MNPSSPRAVVILNELSYRDMWGGPLLRNAIATAAAQMENNNNQNFNLMVRRVHLHCKYSLRIDFLWSQTDGPITSYPLATDAQARAFIAKALRDGYDAAMNE